MRIEEKLKRELIKYFDTKNFEVSLIHNEEHLCVRSHQREILYSIKEYYETKNIYFDFKENFYGKCIYVSLSLFNENNIEIVNLEPIYKKYFIKRANKIFLSINNEEKTSKIKNEFEKLINTDFKMEEYVSMRNLLDTLL